MTDLPLPPVPHTPRPSRRRRWPWVLLLLAALLGLGAWLAPGLLGQWALRQVSAGGTRVTAEGVGGPLWSPSLRGARVGLPGVQATAGEAGVRVTGVDLRNRVVRVRVNVQDADVRLRLKDLVAGTGGTATPGGPGWKVVLDGLDVGNTRVSVDGSGLNVPNGQFRITPGKNGALTVRGRTDEGDLNADVTVRKGAAGNVFGANLDADARVLNHYWPGVTGGRIAGRYSFGADQPVRGDLKITGGRLRVPGAGFVTVQGVSGTATHRGDQIALALNGRGWNGPVTARGGVDLKAQNWSVTADASPTVAGLAKSLGTTGEGNLKLRVTAGGWSTVRVKAYGAGAGKLAGVPFRDLKAEYTFLNQDAKASGAGQTNDLAFSARTALSGDQRLSGRWAFGRAGEARWAGTFAQKPLDVRADIDANNRLTLSGQGLGGPLAGTFGLKDQRLAATLNPTYGAAGARMALSGTPSDLRATVTNGTAGPFALAGTARLSKTGLKADLGSVALDLDRNFRGGWRVQNLTGAGVTLGGSGQLDLTGGDVRGQLTARVPGLPETLSGPLNVNYLRQEGTFSPGAQRLTWRGENFTLAARNLAVAGGARVSGTMTVNNRLKAVGTLTARGNGFNVTATGVGDALRLRGTANGVTVLADTQLAPGFRTTARVQGADIRGTLSVEDGVRFDLTTGGERARGVLKGQDWDASGRVNLAALRPLTGVKDLNGTLDLNLLGQGGTARVNAAAAGAKVRGTLTRAGGRVDADLTGTLAGARAVLAGQVFPQVQASGRASWQGQTLNAALNGEYGNLRARITGRTGELSFGGVTVPGQAVNLTGTVTPRLTASGTWGDLAVRYDAGSGLASVSGAQALTAFGQAGRVQGQATWGPGPNGSTFRGMVNARGVLDQYTVALRGPWSDLSVLLTDAEGLRATGRAALPSGRYDLNVRGPVAGLFVDGRVQGSGLEPRGTVNVFDGAGGSARVSLRGFSDLTVRSRGLTLAGQKVQGDLTARGGLLSGDLTAGPLRLTARDGQVRTTGTLAGHTLTATGRLTLPATLNDLRANVTGPYLTAEATGGVANLRGSVRLRPQTFGSGGASVTVPAQTFPLSASLTGGRARVGGLTYSGGRWSGGLNLNYALAARRGTVRLVGEGAGLAAVPFGPVAGRVTLLPALGGTLTTDLTAALPLLPAQVRTQFVPGQLVAALGPKGAKLATRGTRYGGQPLTLDARASWGRGVKVQGLLTHPSLRVPVRYDGRDLTLRGARLDARLLRPLVDASGTVAADLTLPALNPDRASGQLRVNLLAAGQPARGTLTLRNGQFGGRLRAGPLDLVAEEGRVKASAELAGHTLRASGRLTGLTRLDQLLVNVTGPYLTASASGDLQRLAGALQLREQAFGSGAARTQVPAQRFSLSASPARGAVQVGDLIYAGGRWSGDLRLGYALSGRGGVLSIVGGGQTLAALPSGPLGGRLNLLPALSGTVTANLAPFLAALPENVRAELTPGLLTARVTADGAVLGSRGTRYLGQPLTLTGAANWRGGVTALAELSHPDLRLPVRYDGRDLTVRGARLDARALRPFVDASGTVTTDLTLPGLNVDRANGRVNADLLAADQRVNGTLNLRNGVLDGRLRAGPLDLVASGNRLTATGELAGYTLNAAGRLTGLTRLDGLLVNVTGPYLTARASGDLERLTGNLTLRAQGYGSGDLRATLPAQSLALTAAPTRGTVRVGGLTYSGGRWSGGAALRYALGTRAGTLTVAGGGQTLAALPSGPLGGRVNLLPTPGGTVTVELSPFLAALPENVRAEVVPGRLTAQVSADGATLRNVGTRYLDAPLDLTGAVRWRGGVTASALLTHPDLRLPVRYDGRDLTVAGAVVNARALRPLVDATGRITASLTVPGLDFGRANGGADVNLAASGQRAVGRVTLAGGQLSADLTSDLGGQDVRVRGPLYPRADAVLTLGDVRATVTGDAAETITLRAAGTHGGRALDLTATGRALTGTKGMATVSGLYAGASLNLSLNRAAGDWRAQGSVNVPDLQPLVGTVGSVRGTVTGTLSDLRLNLDGEAAGVAFRAPATFSGGVLRVQGASATLPGTLGTVRASGPVFPTLNLSARASLNEGLPGTYTVQALGSFGKPDVRAQGRVTGAVGGLEVAGTELSARLLGRDWKINLTGEALAGFARGTLNSGALGGLQDSRLTVHAPLLSGDTRVRLDGVTGWNVRTGWLGQLRAVGNVPGGVLDATLSGAGPLALAARVGPARVTGSFPADLPLKPGGTLDLAALDVGALWGRADQLRATGRATLAGTSWNRLEAGFAGRVDDTGAELSGDLTANYRAGDLAVRLAGERVSGDANLKAGRFGANLKADTFRAARLLPPAWKVDALTFAGRLSATGSLAGGLERVEAQNLALRGEQEAAGPFSLYGRATFQRRAGQPDVLDTELSGSLRGGVLRATGALPGGVRVTGRDVDARAFGVGTVGADLTLSGPAENLVASGQASATARDFDALVTLSGLVRDARANARVTLKGAGRSGTLYAQAERLDLNAGTVQARVYGTAQQGGNRVSLDLSGAWPRLSGEAAVTLPSLPAPVVLRGDGAGGYTLNAGTLGAGRLTLGRGQGFIPTLAGALRLTPLPLVDGTGEAVADVQLAGTLAAPRVSGTLTTRGAEVSGVRLADTAGTFSGSLNGLRGTLTQAGAAVATLADQTLTLSGLTATAAGSTVRASGTAALNGASDVTLTASGAVDGNVRSTYRAGALTARGNVSASGVGAALDMAADPFTGWRGTARVTGGPNGVLTQAASLKLSGPYAHPLVTGEAGLLGAGARLVANRDGVQLRLVDAPGVTASGVLELRPSATAEEGWRWLGTAAITRPELSLSVTPTGPLADPALTLSLRRGEWRAAGTASLRAADLDVTDGAATGRVTWNADTLRANLPGLDLARLGVEGVTGRINASGELATRSGNGRLTARITDVTTNYEVPYLGLTVAGDIDAGVTLTGGRARVQATAALPSGTVTLNAAQGERDWTGTLTGTLTRGDGTLTANVASGTEGLTGGVTATNYPLKAAGQEAKLAGTVTLRGQTFSAALTAANGMGGVRVNGEGGLGDLLPALEGVTAVRPTDQGYRVRALLDDVDLARLKLAPGLAGVVNGEATIRDGGGTVVISSSALGLGQQQLGARVEGTLVGGDWRLRGFLGNSEFFASLTGGTLSGRGTLQALPIGALVGAFTGTTVGEGVVTGVARFTLPLADPLAGSATVVAERIRVTAARTGTEVAGTVKADGSTVGAADETLTGTGSLDYANRELRNVNIQLAGAGTWDVRGGYTRQRVDLTAQFRDTTFTPVLRLLPGLTGLTPSLRGTVTLSAAGTYERPRALLRAQSLVGAVAGLSLQVPTFAADLPDTGALTASGRVLTGGTVGSDGTVEARGQLTLGKLSGARVTFSGLLAPQALGALPNTTVALTQAGERWVLDARSRSANGGTLALTGAVAPRLDLALAARGYNLPLTAIYARESVLNADLRAADDGTLIRVGGAANFSRLTLGRANAAATIPAPGQSSGAPGSGTGRTTDDFASPLPVQYTVFPRPQADGTAPTPALPFLERIVFEDLPIQAPAIRIDEALARAEFSGGLVLSGTGARPTLRGGVTAQRGTLSLRENEFTLRTGQVTFSGEGVLPTFAASAAGTVPSATTGQRVPVTVDVRGEFQPLDSGGDGLNLTTTLSCTAALGDACTDPSTGNAYTEAQLYALVATGVPNLEALPSNLGALGTSALQTALNVFVLGELERSVARALGLDVFRFAPSLLSDGSLGATLRLGSYLTRDLYLQYQVDLSGQGLIDATYNTPDGRLTFKVSTPLSGLNLESVRPSFSAAYNFDRRTSVSLGVQNDPESTRIRFGITYRLFR